jgi:type VI secretion system secreted protein VgrG
MIHTHNGIEVITGSNQNPLVRLDALVPLGFTGNEGISRLFRFQLDLLARNGQTIEKLLGQPVTIRLPHYHDGQPRYFSGIASRVTQGGRNDTFTSYSVEIVPKLWLLTNRTHCRIFQRDSVPDILQKVLASFDVDALIQRTFYPREYCVQYRETDFNFISRLMEEEGIYYFFRHDEHGHTLVIADSPETHPDITNPRTLVFLGSEEQPVERGRRIRSWSKTQQLRPGKFTLYDHHFQLPGKHLDADKNLVASVQAGAEDHLFKIPVNEGLEIFDYPGEYARRFDGVSRGGGEQSDELDRIFEENQRTVDIRMQQEAVHGLIIYAASDNCHLIPGHQFTLTGHANANGDYRIVAVSHSARDSAHRSGGGEFYYENYFSCIPLALPYRPAVRTPRPAIQGTQSAVVVGLPDTEIFTDKYGRVKVQFPWERDGPNNANSSCWVRVAQPWAGKRWGTSFWPRVGQEVVVAFEEGNPDRPIIIGSVYNEEQMPPYLGNGPDARHKEDNRVSGIKTCTTPGGEGFNELRFDDAKGSEQVFIHAERALDVRVKSESRERVGGSRHLIVGNEENGDQRELVHKDKHLTVKGMQVELIEDALLLTVGGNQDIVVKKVRKQLIQQDDHVHVQGGRNEQVDGDQSLTVGGSQQAKVGRDHALEAGQAIHIKAGTAVVIEAGAQLSLKVGSSFIDIGPAGIAISGPQVMINSGGAPGSGGGCSPAAAEDAQEAAPLEPDVADNARSGSKSAPERREGPAP